MKSLFTRLGSGLSGSVLLWWGAAACFLAVPWNAIGQDEEGEGAAEEEVDFGELGSGVDADLRRALQQLAEQRKQIAEERPALAKETGEIAAELREKRRLAELARQERDAVLHEVGALKKRVAQWRDERVYIESLLGEFRSQHLAAAGSAGAEEQRERFLAAEGGGEDGLMALLDIAEEASANLPKLAGAQVVEGEALDSAGVAKEGRFVDAGPVTWFVSDDGDEAGLVTLSPDLRPEVIQGTAGADEIEDLAGGLAAAPRFDPTMGTAMALKEVEGSWLDHVRKGGFWIYPILLLALIAAVVAVIKWIQLAKIRAVPGSVVREVVAAVNRGKEKAAKAALANVRHPAGAVLERGIEMRGRSKEDVEEALYERFLEAQPPLQRGLPLIAIASATAPLLGLLGTVTGMIHTFKLINLFGTGDAKSLSSGISEALVTTEFGLAVAIPALILHALLSRKVQGIRSAMEMASLAFVNGLNEPKKGGQS